jgi:opacity protein-like surface antigen
VIALSQLNSDRRGGGRLVVAVVAALAAAPAAFAADVLAPTPAYTKAPAPIANDWTGFYLGAGVGARSSQVDGDVTQNSIDSFNIFFGGNLCAPSGSSCSGASLNGTAVRISPYLGYNYQFATQWLAGIEGDVGFGSKTTTLANAFYPNTGISSFHGQESFAVKTGWDAGLRARLGFLVTPSFLVYGTGGPPGSTLTRHRRAARIAFLSVSPELLHPQLSPTPQPSSVGQSAPASKPCCRKTGSCAANIAMPISGPSPTPIHAPVRRPQTACQLVL